MRVLYVSHTGLVGGGERSLLALMDAVSREHDVVLACPPGPLRARAAERGIRMAPIVEASGSLRLHPVQTPSAFGAMAVAAAGALRAARACHADLIHANSIRAGLITASVARALRRPLVVHVRDCLPPAPLTRRLQSGLAVQAAAVIAISHHVARAFDPGHAARRLRVIDNPFDLARLDPLRVDRAGVRAYLGLAPGVPVLTLIGQITPWKGQEEAIRALARVRGAHPSAELLLVGEAKFVARGTRHDNIGYLRRLHDLAAELGVGDAVHFMGEREEVPQILRASDVALLPSWEEPFGRAVVEAMAMGVPVVATAVGGPAEIIHDGVDGSLVAPRRPEALAAAVIDLLSDPARRRATGAAARAAVLARFDHRRHATAVTELYRAVLSPGCGTVRGAV